MLSNKPFKNIDKNYESGKITIRWSPDFNERFYNAFKDNGILQEILDAEILKGMTEYVPRDTGAMLDYALTHTNYGEGIITFKGPYVIPQYEGFRTTKDGKIVFFENYSNNDTGKRGAEWFERWKEDNEAEVVEFMSKKIGEILNGRNG